MTLATKRVLRDRPPESTTGAAGPALSRTVEPKPLPFNAKDLNGCLLFVASAELACRDCESSTAAVGCWMGALDVAIHLSTGYEVRKDVSNCIGKLSAIVATCAMSAVDLLAL